MHRYTNVAPCSHSVGSLLSSPTASNPAGTPKHVEHQAREASLSETALASRSVSPSRNFDAITIKDHAVPLTVASAPASFSEESRSSSTISRTRSDSSPGVFAPEIASTPSAVDNEVTFSQQLTEIAEVSSPTAPAGTGSTIRPSPSSDTSDTAPSQTSTASPVNIGSSRTTGIVIGTVLGGTAVLLIVILAIIYVAWRRRRKRRDQTDKGEDGTQQQTDESTSGAGNNDEERKQSIESPMTLPLQGAATPRPRTLRSEPIVDISPITPIAPHLSRWTSEKADIPSPAGHPAFIDSQPHLRHRPLSASIYYDHDADDEAESRHEQRLSHQSGEVSPCSISSSSPSPPSPEPPSLGTAAAAEAEAEAQALGGFLFFDSPSSRSSRRPSTRDSSVPCTALSMPPLHRGPTPRRRHTRAGGAARSRRGSGSSVGGGRGCGRGSVDFSGGGGSRFTRPPTPPPPLPLRRAARSKSLHDAERPAAWI
ncbi:hypothetical protein F5883DRAFT_46704 [Diaporthe sp. PMI_573]|nr:hypothetical protein F5883DRAFT_46704 [Diaporthaceae sp. PMI_573]